MFGKGGGPLNAWIREFCELVFIQTLQAFIFALVISFVLNMMTVTMSNEVDQKTALSVICIVALTSIFKVEEIARRIFGFGPTKADHGNAVQSIGKGMMAFRMGKNLLDNGRKIVGGAGAFLGSHGDKVKAMKRYNKQLGALEADNKSGGAQSSVKKSITLSSATGNKGNDEARKAKIAERDKLINQAKAKTNEANNKRNQINQMNKTKPKNNQTKAQRNEEKQQLELQAQSADQEAKNLRNRADKIQAELDAEESTAGSSAPVTITFDGGNGGGGSSRANNYNQKRLQYEEEYKAKMKEIGKRKKQGVRTMVSGFAETGAAMVGFTAGSAMSLASTNDFGQALSDGITTAGTADAVTAGAVDLTFAVGDFVDNRLKNVGDVLSEYGKNVADAYEESVAQMNQIDKDITAQTQKEMENMNKEAEQAMDRAVKNASRSSGGRSSGSRARNIGKAVVKGAGTTIKSQIKDHSVVAQKRILEQTKARVNASYAASAPSKDIDRNIYN